MRTRLFVLPSVLIVVGLSGCPAESGTGTDGGGVGIDTPPLTFPDCDAIIEACHDVDPGTGSIHDCHETAHDAASNDPCAPIRVSCVAMCEAIDGGLSDYDAGEHAHP